MDFSIFVCPDTQQDLEPASKELVTALNIKVRKKALVNVAGQTVRKPLDGALVRADRKLLYPIRHGLPILLVHEAIDAYQIGVREVMRMMS